MSTKAQCVDSYGCCTVWLAGRLGFSFKYSG